jgi:hypothetical protein
VPTIIRKPGGSSVSLPQHPVEVVGSEQGTWRGLLARLDVETLDVDVSMMIAKDEYSWPQMVFDFDAGILWLGRDDTQTASTSSQPPPDSARQRYRSVSSGIRLCIHSNPMDRILNDRARRRVPVRHALRAKGVVSGREVTPDD